MHCSCKNRYIPLPCINCKRSLHKELCEWICRQDGFRPRPISEIRNCKSLNEYRENKKRRMGNLKKQ